jgi:hypothetical protein
MPRISGVVKSEGDYEFQMAKEEAKSQTNDSTSTARCAAGCSARPASGARWRRDLKKILVRPAPCDCATSPTAAVYAPAH